MFAPALAGHESTDDVADKLARLARRSELPVLSQWRQNDQPGPGALVKSVAQPQSTNVPRATAPVGVPELAAVTNRPKHRQKSVPGRERCAAKGTDPNSTLTDPNMKVFKSSRSGGGAKWRSSNGGTGPSSKRRPLVAPRPGEPEGLAEPPTSLPCGRCAACDVAQRADMQLGLTRTKMNEFKPGYPLWSLKWLKIQLRDFRLQAENFHNFHRATTDPESQPSDVQVVTQTEDTNDEDTKLFERQTRQDFYLHHTISADRTGTNFEVASRILSLLGEKQQPGLGQRAADKVTTVSGADSSSRNAVNYCERPSSGNSVLQEPCMDAHDVSKARSEEVPFLNWQLKHENVPDDVQPSFHAKWVGDSRHFSGGQHAGLRPGDFFWGKDENSEELLTHVTASFQMPRDHYEVLGVSKLSDISAIEYAYRKVYSNFHIDRYEMSTQDLKRDAQIVYDAIQKAYKVLGDPVSRSKYDLETQVSELRKSLGPGKQQLQEAHAFQASSWYDSRCPACGEAFGSTSVGQYRLCTPCLYDFSPMPTEERWRKYRSHITSLHAEERRSIDEIVAVMKTGYGFSASKKAYELLLKEWGVLNRSSLTSEIPMGQMPESNVHNRTNEKVTSSDTMVSEPSMKPARVPQPKEWHGYKSLIIHQYVHKDNSIKDLGEFMDHVCQFSATERMYKDHFRSWKVSKPKVQPEDELRRLKENCTFCSRDRAEKARNRPKPRQLDRRLENGTPTPLAAERINIQRDPMAGSRSSGKDNDDTNSDPNTISGLTEVTECTEEHLLGCSLATEGDKDASNSEWEEMDEDDADHVFEI
jgi:curved DNA-binding protein CbpA